MNWMQLTHKHMHRVTFPAQTQGSNFNGQVEESTGYDISSQKAE